MPRLLIATTAILLVTQIAATQTVIPGGNVSGVWTYSGSPYLIEGEIIISPTDSLVIEPCVDVIFQGHYKFIINGWLIAQGTETDSILFSAADTSAGWHSLRFIDAPGTSILNYCIIEYGNAYGGYDDSRGGGIFADSSHLVLNHCSIRSNRAVFDGGGITLNESTAVVQNSDFTNNTCDNFGSRSEGGGLQAEDSICDIVNCSFTGNKSLSLFGGGGGFYYNYSDGVISNCTILDNEAPLGLGGGFYISWSDPEIENCLISGNSAEDGGAAYLHHHDGAITGCDFINNTAAEWANINCYYSDVTFTDCNIISNHAGTAGGGLEVSGGSPVFYNCLIESNVSDYIGGGIYFGAGSLIMNLCIIRGNYAQDTGGGIYTSYSRGPLQLYKTQLIDNEAGIRGGGLWCYNLSPFNPDNITNCTFVGNAAPEGGGISIEGWANPVIVNTIIANTPNGSGIYFDTEGSGVYAYCDFYDNQGGDFSGNIPTGLGHIVTTNINGDPCDIYHNIFEDPLFEDPLNFNFQITWNNWPVWDESRSPCINAGDPTQNADPDSTIADIGALYFHQAKPVSIELVPFLIPIQIPSQGGSFEFYLFATNNDSISVNADVWIEVLFPDSTIREPLTGTFNVDFNPGTIGWYRVQNVPQIAPGGDYSYICKIGIFPGHWDSDTLEFEKLETADGGLAIDDWLNCGEEFEEIAALNESSTTDGFALYSAYPNPFNPTTAISYQLSALSHVNLVVYDISGRLVAELVNGWRDAGVHEVTWDATNLASGLYFCHMQAGDFTVARKIVLVK